MFFLIFFSLGAEAQQSRGLFRWNQTRLSFNYMQFSGEETESLSTNSVGYGVEVSSKKTGSFISLMGKARGLYITGTEPFLDGATETDLAFTIIAAEPHLGLIFNLIPGEIKGLRPYIGATGFGGILQLRFDADDVTTLKPSESVFYSGYESFVGVEFFYKGQSSNLKSVYAELALRKAEADIADKTPYMLDGIVLTGGLSF